MKSFFNSQLFLLLKTARPKQWLKNFALYAALVFSGFFFYKPEDGPSYFYLVSYAFIIFCLLTSSTYILNDLFDIEADRKHPFKKNRPLASGKLSIPTAIFAIAFCLALVFWLSLPLTLVFKLLIFAYLILQILYSLYFKQIAILDIISIAAGFLIRVYAGAVVVNLHMSVWFLLTVISMSLFLAVGKRQSERILMTEHKLSFVRKSLNTYSARLLDQYTSIFATSTWLTYALFAFQSSPGDGLNLLYERFPNLVINLPRTLQSQKLLMLTLPLVIFGIMRYLQLVYEENRGEAPADVLLKDKTLLVTVFLWFISVMFVFYA
ncbi:MAG TPA: UbiA prenyltransferase family protein [Candidatus Woesebacteria bacterium]|jgi:4-hydroxybenzoate polyprenyltransferase|nr:UbiA prenyltransferase family protein [Candidatus Woesebacteria bacterium]